MQICSTEKCYGCAVCADNCPVNAITMKADTGFYRPVIDSKKCLSCGLCKKVCISNRDVSLPSIGNDILCFAAYSKDDTIHYECASGGLCTEISRQFIKDGGIVIGARWNKDIHVVEHCVCKTIEELDALKKSKYVQSKVQGVFKEISKYIDSYKCLFIGVPCQVYAVKEFFKNKSDYLYCIDLLCRGGSSPLCLQEHLYSICDGGIDDIGFRGGKDDCYLTLYKGEKLIYRGPQFTDPYFNYFMRHVLYQERCYECPFAGKRRVGDLTIGDFWGLSEEALPKSGGKGINMVFENTDKGRLLLENVGDYIVLEKRSANEAIRGNETLQRPTEQPGEYHELWGLIHKVGFVRALDYYRSNDYYIRVKESYNDWRKYKAALFIKRIKRGLTRPKGK